MDPIRIKCDYDTLVSLSYTAWRGDASYDVEVEEKLPGYTKLVVNYFPLGKLGTIEIKKDVAVCVVSFSDVNPVENYDEMFKEAKQEVAQDASGYEENDIYAMTSMLSENFQEKLRIKKNPKLHEARERKWVETIYEYKRMIKALRGVSESQKPEKPKQKGRYRLTKEEIKKRKKIVKEATRIKNESPFKTWQQVANEIDVPVRTLRDWRHNF